MKLLKSKKFSTTKTQAICFQSIESNFSFYFEVGMSGNFVVKGEILAHCIFR